MLELRGIEVRFAGRPILDGVNLCLRPGQRLALTGQSGSGKSTLLKIAILFQLPQRGQVLWDGQPVSTARLSVFRSQFLYVGQKPLPFDGTVGEYLNLPYSFAANRSLRIDEKRQNELLRAMNLDPSMKRGQYSSLSGGEQQRMTIIQGLQLNRPYCLFDEITSSLDEETTHRVIDVVAAEPERSILAVTHNRIWMEHGFTEVRLENGCLEVLA